MYRDAYGVIILIQALVFYFCYNGEQENWQDFAYFYEKRDSYIIWLVLMMLILVYGSILLVRQSWDHVGARIFFLILYGFSVAYLSGYYCGYPNRIRYYLFFLMIVMTINLLCFFLYILISSDTYNIGVVTGIIFFIDFVFFIASLFFT